MTPRAGLVLRRCRRLPVLGRSMRQTLAVRFRIVVLLLRVAVGLSLLPLISGAQPGHLRAENLTEFALRDAILDLAAFVGICHVAPVVLRRGGRARLSCGHGRCV